MDKTELTLNNGDTFFVEKRNCEATGQEYVVAYMDTHEPTKQCETNVIGCNGVIYTIQCKTRNTKVDCTKNPPIIVCVDGPCT
ncbi:hypothetical protein CIG75_04800 [Tumebacillus algifaecis]|uniref:Uncharacterized protein n=1 Tax=Tumebacillus algifaecis TaxID=1214604 RepID=A0A223CYE8_9BACL|nr:hypothetical protein [Tumebacillus algifaecis]ASS74368.1 hypothetical protein CIG75_04800 [Tumebacillus algifaecis]